MSLVERPSRAEAQRALRQATADRDRLRLPDAEMNATMPDAEATFDQGDAYEELLAKGAEDVKTGAGQYFTPRALISAMVDRVQPGPDDTIADPACGTGGFLLAAHEYIVERYGSVLTPEQRGRLNSGAITGTELVDGTARLAAMNMLVHGIGKPNGASLIDVRDGLAEAPA